MSASIPPILPRIPSIVHPAIAQTVLFRDQHRSIPREICMNVAVVWNNRRPPWCWYNTYQSICPEYIRFLCSWLIRGCHIPIQELSVPRDDLFLSSASCWQKSTCKSCTTSPASREDSLAGQIIAMPISEQRRTTSISASSLCSQSRPKTKQMKEPRLDSPAHTNLCKDRR